MQQRIKIFKNSQIKLARLNFHQKFAVTSGFFLNFLMAVYSVNTGVLRPGDLVFLNMLMIQIFGPLFNLGNMYRIWQESFYQINELLDLLAKQPSIKDKEGAKDLVVTEGVIEFRSIKYNYQLANDASKGDQKKKIDLEYFLDEMDKTQTSKLGIVQKLIKFFNKYFSFGQETPMDQIIPRKKVTETIKEDTQETKAAPIDPQVIDIENPKAQIFDDFNFKIETNQTILITGSSGSANQPS